MNLSNNADRLEFAHSLRGLATLSVLIWHFLGVFWLSPSAVSALLNTNTLDIAAPLFVSSLHFSQLFNYGSFGVALFFLISGFVIPFSLSELSRPAFIIARIFRIYPVYIFAFGMSITTLWLLSLYGIANNFPYKINQIIYQATLTRGWLWIPSIDGVSWTLEIEFVFYVIAALFSPYFLNPKRGGRMIIGYALLVPIFCLIGINFLEVLPGRLQTIALFLTYVLPFTIFMSIGTLFYLASINNLSPTQLVFGVAATLFGFSVGLAAHPALNASGTSSYFLAVTVFFLFWLLRSDFESNRFLDWLADISYPLYAVHPIVGYASMYLLSSQKISPLIIILVSLIIVTLLAWWIHLKIEKVVMLFGKNLGKKLFPKRVHEA